MRDLVPANTACSLLAQTQSLEQHCPADRPQVACVILDFPEARGKTKQEQKKIILIMYAN